MRQLHGRLLQPRGEQPGRLHQVLLLRQDVSLLAIKVLLGQGECHESGGWNGKRHRHTVLSSLEGVILSLVYVFFVIMTSSSLEWLLLILT